jgi:hypothetical protein
MGNVVGRTQSAVGGGGVWENNAKRSTRTWISERNVAITDTLAGRSFRFTMGPCQYVMVTFFSANL